MLDLGVSDLLSLVQTTAIIAALLITLYFSRKQIQALATDLESRVLNDLDEKFHRLGEIFVEHPELVRTIYQTPEAMGPEVPLAYFVVFFCAHAYHMRQRGILQDNEWTGWKTWMENAFKYGTIRRDWVEGGIREVIDPAFREFVEKEILTQPVAPVSQRQEPVPRSPAS